MQNDLPCNSILEYTLEKLELKSNLDNLNTSKKHKNFLEQSSKIYELKH